MIQFTLKSGSCQVRPTLNLIEQAVTYTLYYGQYNWTIRFISSAGPTLNLLEQSVLYTLYYGQFITGQSGSFQVPGRI